MEQTELYKNLVAEIANQFQTVPISDSGRIVAAQQIVISHIDLQIKTLLKLDENICDEVCTNTKSEVYFVKQEYTDRVYHKQIIRAVNELRNIKYLLKNT